MAKRQGSVSFSCSGWQITLYEDGTGPTGPDWEREMAAYISRFANPDSILKDDHRAMVGTVDLDGVRYVVKKFTIQETWFWFRFTSLFFPTLGEIASRNGLRLSEAGILTPRPTLLMQRTRRGMVLESWLVYQFLEGQSLTADDVGDMVSFVKRMHQAGWVHRDPHPSNFIRTSQGVATIDPIKARHRPIPYLKAYDLVLMTRDMPSAPELYGRNRLGFWYKVARCGHALLRFYRGLKHFARRSMGLPGSGGGYLQ